MPFNINETHCENFKNIVFFHKPINCSVQNYDQDRRHSESIVGSAVLSCRWTIFSLPHI